jgi:hypothetical protein
MNNRPIFLFLLLLIVLVISVLMGNTITLTTKESFVSFQEKKNPIDLVQIPTYSTTANVVKLYDNVFFDNKNGNVIEVDSSSSTGNIDATGLTISSTYVVPRLNNGSSISYSTKSDGKTVTAQDTKESLISPVSLSYNSYYYPTQSKQTSTYNIFYFPWNDQTFVHIINKSTFSNVSSFYFGPNNKMETFKYPLNSTIGITSYVPFTLPTSTNDLEPLYEPTRPLYMVGPNVRYDIQNGILLIKTTNDSSSKSINVYARDGSYKTITSAGQYSAPNSLANITFQPFVALDSVGQNIVLYLPYQTFTVVALIGYGDTNKLSLVINNVCRFTTTTIDKGPNANTSTATPNNLTKDSNISEYFKWYWYWKNQSGGGDQKYSEDYLLKTQIVPPVCPSCPTCNSGTCTNCGGNGGSGTLAKNGNTVVNGNNVPRYNNNNPNSVGGVLNKGIGAVENVAVDVIDNASGLIKGFGSGVKDVLTQGNRTTINNTNNPNGLVNRSNNINRTEGDFKSPYGTQNIDQYSYYGALSNKGSGNFMPITSDFSKFGR